MTRAASLVDPADSGFCHPGPSPRPSHHGHCQKRATMAYAVNPCRLTWRRHLSYCEQYQ